MNAALSGPNGRVELGNTVLKIGRFPENQLVVTDAKASSYHAEIHSEANGYTILDLGSTNGTFVNEQRLIPHSPRSLNAGDSIRIGDTNYIYEAENESFYAPTLYASPVSLNGPLYPPTVASGISPASESVQSAQEYPEYQALSPVYAPLPPSSPAQGYPPPQDSVPPQASFAPLQPPPIQPSVVAPQKKSRKRLWIILAAAVLFLICALAGTLIYLNLPTPTKALDAFCDDMKTKKGDAAFNLFSDAIKNQASSAGRQIFVSTVNKGQIVGCTHSAPTTSNENSDAQIILTAVDGTTQRDNVHLVPDSSGAWKISNLQNT